jgi:la-related protein 1
MDLLDQASYNGINLLDLQKKQKQKENSSQFELNQCKKKKQQLKMDILQATQLNTTLLEQMALLNEKQLMLEKELNHHHHHHHHSDGQQIQQQEEENENQIEKESKERHQMIQLVKLQAKEIEALKQEIGLLRGKNGKIYAPRT